MFEGLYNNLFKDDEMIFDVKNKILAKLPLVGTDMVDVNIMAAKIPTASTDGKNIYYNPKFFQSLSEDERAGLIAHELLHIAFDHISRSKDKNHQLWNYATDAVINQILKEEGLVIPKDGVDVPMAKNKSVEEVYKLLEKKQEDLKSQNESEKNKKQNNKSEEKQEQNKQSGQQEQNNRSNNQEQQSQSNQQKHNNSNKQQEQNNQQGKDNQNCQQSIQQEQNCQNQNCQNSQQGQNNQNSQQNQNNQSKQQSQDNQQEENEIPEDLTNINAEKSHKMWEKMAVQMQKKAKKESKELPIKKDEKEFVNENKQKKDELGKEIRRKIANKVKFSSSKVGTKSGGMEGEFGELENLKNEKPVISWKRILKREFEKEEDRWCYRRADESNDFCARIGEVETYEKPSTEVLIDTSGSIDDSLLISFLRQLKPLLDESKLYVGCFDTEFYGFKEIKTIKDINNYKFVGRGGTCFDTAIDSFTKSKKINKIIFTDGCCSVACEHNKKYANINWLVYDNTGFNTEYGKVIHINKKDIIKQKEYENTK